MNNQTVIEDLAQLQEALDNLDFWLIGFDNGLVDADSAKAFSAETPSLFELATKAQRHLNTLMNDPRGAHMKDYLRTTEHMIQNVVAHVCHKLAVHGVLVELGKAA